MASILLGGRLPFPAGKVVRVGEVVVERYNNRSMLKLTDKRLGLFDLGRKQFLVDGAVVDLLQGNPLAWQDPVEFDDPADQVGVSLLPERLLALAEELIQK